MQNIGLVGLGFMGKTHLEAYHQIDHAQVTAIYTRNKASHQGIPNHYSFVSDYNELLKNNDIDIIDICLPTYLHEEYIIMAANAGKHIICEKPLTLTEKSANRIAEAIKKSKVNLFLAHVLRFWPEYQAIKAYSETDLLKKIDFVHAKRLGQAPKWSSWFQYPEKSGGALFDLHIHDIDFLYYLLGEVETVYAVGNRNQYGAYDHVMTSLTFKNKCKAYVEASQKMPESYPFTMSLRAQSDQAVVDFNLIAGENIENINESNSQLIYYNNQKKTSIEIDKGNAFQNELAYFVHCVENKKENTIIPLEDVFYTLKVVRAIETSLETGQLVQV
jgi:predicted dehydrogenase